MLYVHTEMYCYAERMIQWFDGLPSRGFICPGYLGPKAILCITWLMLIVVASVGIYT